MIKTLRWTNRQPNVEGWFWFRWSGQHVPYCIEVFKDKQRRWCASRERTAIDETQFLDNMTGQWAGPIPTPREQFCA